MSVDGRILRGEGMEKIRKAEPKDCSRIAEILIFNWRINFYPIFQDEAFYFKELEVASLTAQYANDAEYLDKLWVYDDGVVKGFIELEKSELVKLYVDSFFQSRGIGAKLLEKAEASGATKLWALEKNVKAIKFYMRHGFMPTGEKKLEEGTEEYLICLRKK